MARTSSEFDLTRVEDKISKIIKELDELRRLSERNEKDKLWELDKVRREFDSRIRNFEMRKEQLTKEMKDYTTQKDRLKFKIEQEKEEEEEEERRLAEQLYKRRMR